MAPVEFLEAPRQYMRWAMRKKPAIFAAMIVGFTGPLIVFTVPPIRKYFGDGPRQQIPLTYPIPKGPRKIPQGYDD
ncbi:hypothetical protein B0A50_06190 [Salinomyces thailandicus]|uniref:NADH-ubiquinone oxidoreductase 9.5 kDa subunit n=1 Tax=Salinomyces thailandicus TaxID=706561 RepID=A0A4U0TTI5_9PEZI|nr:hypothetical protein B0A50_06190 [Salinomyces thailandica]